MIGDESVCSFVGIAPPENQCGNSVFNSGEECEDGNQINGDGCNEECQV